MTNEVIPTASLWTMESAIVPSNKMYIKRQGTHSASLGIIEEEHDCAIYLDKQLASWLIEQLTLWLNYQEQASKR